MRLDDNAAFASKKKKKYEAKKKKRNINFIGVAGDGTGLSTEAGNKSFSKIHCKHIICLTTHMYT